MIEYDKHIEYSMNIINSNENVYFERPRKCGSSTFLRWYAIKYCIEHENVRCLFYNMDNSRTLLDHNYVQKYFSFYINNHNKKFKYLITHINSNYIRFTNSSEIECYKHLQYSMPSNTYDLLFIDNIQNLLYNNDKINVFLSQLMNLDTRKRSLKTIMIDSYNKSNNTIDNYSEFVFLKIYHFYKEKNMNLKTDRLDIKDLENMKIAYRKIKIDEIFN